MENNTEVSIPQMKSPEDFWEAIRSVQNAILAGHDLFISTPPPPPNNTSKSSIDFHLISHR